MITSLEPLPHPENSSPPGSVAGAEEHQPSQQEPQQQQQHSKHIVLAASTKLPQAPGCPSTFCLKIPKRAGYFTGTGQWAQLEWGTGPIAGECLLDCRTCVLAVLEHASGVFACLSQTCCGQPICSAHSSSCCLLAVGVGCAQVTCLLRCCWRVFSRAPTTWLQQWSSL